MDSINPWLDVEELNRLAKALMEPSAKEEVKAPVVDKARNAASSALAKASSLAKEAGVLKSTEPRQATVPELQNWLTENARCEGVCVVDRDGDVLYASMPNQEWTNLTVSMATLGKRLQEGKSPSLRMKVAGGSFLQFIAVTTGRGPLLVGLLTEKLLQDQQFSEFTQLIEKISAPDQIEKA